MAKPMPSFEEELVQEEGLRLVPYKDSKGIWTVGVGHNMEADGLSREELAAAVKHPPITSADAMRLLDQDIAQHDRLLDYYAPWAANLDRVRYRVLRNMVFQMGWGNGHHGLSSFKHTLKDIEMGAYGMAANRMLQSDWARKDSPARAKRMSDRMRTGRYWPNEETT